MLAAEVLAVAVTLGAAVAPAAGGTPCWQTLLHDWRNGSITGTYAVSCYRQALAQMPEDLAIYSSAPDDISRALATHIARKPAVGTPVRAALPAERASAGGGFPTPLIVAGALALALVGLGSAGLVLRRKSA